MMDDKHSYNPSCSGSNGSNTVLDTLVEMSVLIMLVTGPVMLMLKVTGVSTSSVS